MSLYWIQMIKFLLITTISISAAFGHPTGNMISVGEHVLWPYITPVDDTRHQACVMIWREGTSPEILIKSEFPGSDFMLYNREEQLYLIERRYLQNKDHFEIRILKLIIGGEAEEIWGWFRDEWRIGEGGFIMQSDDCLVFGSYPNIYSLEKGKIPIKYFEFRFAVNRIREVGKGRLLLLGDKGCWLTAQNGEIIRAWNNLTEEGISDAPLNRNQVFDADYSNGKLLLAYWGKRSFELIDENGDRSTVSQLRAPMAPHWVAFYGRDKLLFASALDFTGETPKPYVQLYRSGQDGTTLWQK